MNRLRIVTFNIKHGTDRQGVVNQRLLAATCQRFGADVLALQEVDRRAVRTACTDQVRILAQATGLQWCFGEAAGYELAPSGLTFPVAQPRTRIDYVAVAGLDIVSGEAPETPSSDHRPVITEVVARV